MSFIDDVLYWVTGLILAGVVGLIANHLFSDESRARRKRRRNYGRVIARAKRPVVMLNARTRRA